MNKSIKNNAVRSSLLALALAATTLPLWGQAPAAKPKAPAYTPRISADAAGAFYYRKNSSPIGKMMEGVNDIVAKGFFETSKNKDAQRTEKVFAESGLKGEVLRWVVASTPGEFKKTYRMGMFDFSIVYAIKHDPKRVVKALTSVLNEEDDPKFVETTVAGVKAWQVTSEEYTELGMEQYFASLDGQLIFMASSKELLAKEIALYKGKGKTSKAFEKIASEKSALAGLYVRDLGKHAKTLEKEAPGTLAPVDMMVPNGSKILSGAKSLVVKLTAGKDGAAVTGLLSLKDEADANSLKSVADMMLMPMREQFKNVPAEAPEEMKLGADILKGLTLTAKKNTLVLRVPFTEAAVKSLKAQFEAMLSAPAFGPGPGFEGLGE